MDARIETGDSASLGISDVSDLYRHDNIAPWRRGMYGMPLQKRRSLKNSKLDFTIVTKRV